MKWIIVNDGYPQAPVMLEFRCKEEALRHLEANSAPGDRLVGPITHEVWWWDGTQSECLGYFESKGDADDAISRLVQQEGSDSASSFRLRLV